MRLIKDWIDLVRIGVHSQHNRFALEYLFSIVVPQRIKWRYEHIRKHRLVTIYVCSQSALTRTYMEIKASHDFVSPVRFVFLFLRRQSKMSSRSGKEESKLRLFIGHFLKF